MGGFGDRLLHEVQRLAVKDMRIKIFAPPERKYSTWIGGSILAGLSTFRKMWVSIDDWHENTDTKSLNEATVYVYGRTGASIHGAGTGSGLAIPERMNRGRIPGMKAYTPYLPALYITMSVHYLATHLPNPLFLNDTQ